MAVFVFDGPKQAMYKRKQLVVTQPIWIMQLFQAFIATFGFHSHTVRDFFLRSALPILIQEC